MSQTVLGNVVMGYQPLWGAGRSLCAVRLFVRTVPGGISDAQHLLAVLAEYATEQSVPLLLCPQSPDMLADLLVHGNADSPCMEAGSHLVYEYDLADAVRNAAARGMRLVWQAEAGEFVPESVRHCFAQHLLSLTPDHALQALRAAARTPQGYAPDSPVEAGRIYEGLASQALIEHALDQQDCAAVAGWPVEDVLHGWRNQHIQPDRDIVFRLQNAIAADQSMESIEALLGTEPVLVYRFLRYVNSASLSLSACIETVKHGLMMTGYTALGRWLQTQLENASDDANLRPVKAAMVLRAQILGHLLDAGAEQELRHEIYLCGLMSDIGLLTNDTSARALRHLPLPERIYEAVVTATGPYSASLAIARAMASARTDRLIHLCEAHGINLEDANRALLRTLHLIPFDDSSTTCPSRS